MFVDWTSIPAKPPFKRICETKDKKPGRAQGAFRENLCVTAPDHFRVQKRLGVSLDLNPLSIPLSIANDRFDERI